jgi:hypothetical protein
MPPQDRTELHMCIRSPLLLSARSKCTGREPAMGKRPPPGKLRGFRSIVRPCEATQQGREPHCPTGAGVTRPQPRLARHAGVMQADSPGHALVDSHAGRIRRSEVRCEASSWDCWLLSLAVPLMGMAGPWTRAVATPRRASATTATAGDAFPPDRVAQNPSAMTLQIAAALRAVSSQDRTLAHRLDALMGHARGITLTTSPHWPAAARTRLATCSGSPPGRTCGRAAWAAGIGLPYCRQLELIQDPKWRKCAHVSSRLELM